MKILELTKLPDIEQTRKIVEYYPQYSFRWLMLTAFFNLRFGEAFVFINDHGPKPLCYQMEAENDQPIKWEHLMTMPLEWKVKVLKLKEQKQEL